MKKILTLLLLATFFMGCSSDDDKGDTPRTSFIVSIFDSFEHTKCVAGYKLSDGTYKKIADLGSLWRGDFSKEIFISDENIKDIYIFSDYSGETLRFNTVFTLTKNTKNTIIVTDLSSTKVTDKTDSKQYPQ